MVVGRFRLNILLELGVSWKDKHVERILGQKGVQLVEFDQCAFGLRDPQNGKLYKKRTRVMPNCSELIEGLNVQCDHQHDHQSIEGKTRLEGKWVNRSSCAQVYPKQMVETMVGCIRRMKRRQEQEVFAVESLKSDNPDLKESVHRCHNNLGHPSQERFLHMLKVAGASEKAIQLAKEMKCSICLAKKTPQRHPVVGSRVAVGFNHHVCMDTFEVPIYQQKKIKMLNILCEGTGLQVCVPLWKGAEAKHVRSAYRKGWLRWAGVPKKVTTDGGTEFDAEMHEGLEYDGSYVSKIASEAPWQNGRCERHGGLWKDVFQKGFEGCQPRNKYEVNELIDKTNQAKNSMVRKHGYAPYQHVFGNDLRVPQSLLEEHGNTHYLSGMLHGVSTYQRAQEIRQAARKAMVAMDDVEHVIKAVQRQSRPERGPCLVGDFIYYWRKGREAKHGTWRGPGRIIGFYSHNKIWVSHVNKVLRCAPEQLRKMSEEERVAITCVTPDMLGAISNKNKRGAHVFMDITDETFPGEEERQVDVGNGEQSRDVQDMEVEEEEYAQTTPAASPLEQMESEEEVTMMGEDGTVPGSVTSVGATNMEWEPSGTVPGSTMSGGAANMKLESDDGNNIAQAVQLAPVATPHLDHQESSSYGPLRRTPLTEALRRSTDILDFGTRRVSTHDGANVTTSDIETHNEVMEVMYTQLVGNGEVRDHELTHHEKNQIEEAKREEWNKLLKHEAIKVHQGEEAEKLKRDMSQERFLESRFVKTRKQDPTRPGGIKLECRWCIKGFKDPDLLDLDRQSPTLSMDGLSVCLQLISSNKWRLIVADVEGLFCKGNPLSVKTGGCLSKFLLMVFLVSVVRMWSK